MVTTGTAANASAAVRCATRDIIGEVAMINSIFAPTAVNQSLMFGTDVDVRSAERQSTYSATTASVYTAAQARSSVITQESARSSARNIVSAAERKRPIWL